MSGKPNDHGGGVRQVGAAPEVRVGVLLTRLVFIGACVLCAVLQYGFHTPPAPVWVLRWSGAALFGFYAIDKMLGGRVGRYALAGIKRSWLETATVCIGLIGIAADVIGDVGGAWRVFEVSALLLLLTEFWTLQVALSRRFYKPGVLMPSSFIALIAAGTVLLKLPLAVPPGQSISWLDALFTMTSAVCVTGLIVRDTATQFTPMGQTIIGVFIQLGGLGIIVFGSMVAMLLGSRFTLRQNLSLSSMLQDMPLNKTRSFIGFVVLTTLGIELAGALALMTLWPSNTTLAQRFGLSVFHAVSAFCNAGFSMQSDSLESYRYAWQVHVVIAGLLVVGGLGFPVLSNLWQAGKWRWRAWRDSRAGRRVAVQEPVASRRLSLHTKLVLCTSAGLYLYGVLGIAAGQLKPYSDAYFQQGVTANQHPSGELTLSRVGGVLADASFLSLTSRTAGFNTTPMDEVSPLGRFVAMTLMIIGASPGSTGGGMKTATVAVLLLTVIATARQRARTEAFARQLHESLVRKAATMAACFIMLITTATGLLCLSEPYPFEKIVFEAVSAASTTGLSLGITGDLTGFGKAVIIATMYLGRVGPLALLGVLMFNTQRQELYTYPHEDVMMG